MKPRDKEIVKSILGADIFDTLKKYEIYKPETKTVVDPAEIRIALEIVPRTVLSFLFANLKWREQGDIADISLPFVENGTLHIEKKGPDNYHGEIIKDGKILNKFSHRSLPAIGLILLTTFELYDVALLDEIKYPEQTEEVLEEENEEEEYDKIEELQDIIDERLMTHRYVQDVVDKRISEREAINKIIKERLAEHVERVNQESTTMEENKKSKLREFLERREQRRQEPIELDKNEIACPDCNTTLYKSDDNKIKLCICFGDSMGKELKFTKKENGKVNIKFPKKFNIEDVEMLLDTIKGNENG